MATQYVAAATALRELRKAHGPVHPEVAAALNNLAMLCHCKGERARPEKLYLRALRMKEHLFGADHPEVALTANNLGLFYKRQGRLREACQSYERALRIFERSFGPADENVAAVLENLAHVWQALAEQAQQRAARIESNLRIVSDTANLEELKIDASRCHFRLAVRPSRIHCFGVFAEESIPGESDIIEYTGERLSRREAVRRWTVESTYLCALDAYWSIDGSHGGSGAQYINHSCEPNVRFRRGDGRVWCESMRPIEHGEELTIDYRFAHDGPRIPCYCGAASCRGTINLLRRRKNGFLSA